MTTINTLRTLKYLINDPNSTNKIIKFLNHSKIYLGQIHREIEFYFYNQYNLYIELWI